MLVTTENANLFRRRPLEKDYVGLYVYHLIENKGDAWGSWDGRRIGFIGVLSNTNVNPVAACQQESHTVKPGF
jgi:hypothetical protein